MAYLTINGVSYLVLEGSTRGRDIEIGRRRRAIDATLLVDRQATKQEVEYEVTGRVTDGRWFTIPEANAFRAVLRGGPLSVSGDSGTFTARATNIGYRDRSDRKGGTPVTHRSVTFTLEEV